MMDPTFRKAHVTGFERLIAWAELLDAINVFPVADGDTGRNLVLTLSPLGRADIPLDEAIRKLTISARGHSGNIAAGFFAEFLAVKGLVDIPKGARLGRERAVKCISEPKPGTMLTVLDVLVEVLHKTETFDTGAPIEKILDHLEKAVLSTAGILPRLKLAGVVDAGALGLFLFLEGFFSVLAERVNRFRNVSAVFGRYLTLSPSFREEARGGFCVDAVLRSDVETGKARQLLSSFSDVVVMDESQHMKIHLHAENVEEARRKINSIGRVVVWAEDDLESQIGMLEKRPEEGCVRVMTDAAGSVTREDSTLLGITLLDSYITAGSLSLPETHVDPNTLYDRMRKGVRVSTSQASLFERHQRYRSVLDRFDRVLYLCVGSAYTGNYDAVMGWKRENDPDGRLTVIDSATASGRLGIVAIATALFSRGQNPPEAVASFARRAIKEAREYVFLDRLRYLAAGGRLSRTGALLGEAFRLKPVICPEGEGAKMVGKAKNRTEQLEFALKRLAENLSSDSNPFIMLEYSDNGPWVKKVPMEEIGNRYPNALIRLQPLSLTSGAHMGPGTWAVAYLPESFMPASFPEWSYP